MMNPQYPQNDQLPSPTPASGYTPPVAPQQVAGAQYTSPVPQAAPQAHNGNNPYEFILNNNQPKPAGFGGGSLAKRLLVVLGGLVVLGIIGAIAFSLLVPKNPTNEQLLSLAQEQQEIIRIAEDVQQHATSGVLRNSAVTVSMSVKSDQTQVVQYLTARKTKVTPKQLALKNDPANSKVLQDARTTNTYDSASSALLKSLITSYNTRLAKIVPTIQGTKAKALTAQCTTHAALLATQLAQP